MRNRKKGKDLKQKHAKYNKRMLEATNHALKSSAFSEAETGLVLTEDYDALSFIFKFIDKTKLSDELIDRFSLLSLSFASYSKLLSHLNSKSSETSLKSIKNYRELLETEMINIFFLLPNPIHMSYETILSQQSQDEKWHNFKTFLHQYEKYDLKNSIEFRKKLSWPSIQLTNFTEAKNQTIGKTLAQLREAKKEPNKGEILAALPQFPVSISKYKILIMPISKKDLTIVEEAYKQLVSLEKEIPDNSLLYLQKIIDKAVDTLSFYVLPDLFSILGINAFKGLTTRNEIKEATKTIIDDYNLQNTNMRNLYKQIETYWRMIKAYQPKETTAIKQLLRDITSFVGEQDIRPNLNNLARHTDLYKTYLIKFQEDFKNIKATHKYGMYRVYDQLILNKLTPIDNPKNDELIQFKNRVKLAVGNYFKKTMTADNVKRQGNRAASENRIQAMQKILDSLNQNNDKEIIADINQAFLTMKFGFFGKTRIGSKLYNDVKHELDVYQKAHRKK